MLDKMDVRIGRVLRTGKPWGYEDLFALADGQYVGKILFVRSGESLSLQFHRFKDETLAVQSGRILLEVGTSVEEMERHQLTPGQSVRIVPGTLHRITAIEDSCVLEASSAKMDWREDVVRLEDRYGRQGTSAP
jgi:mannose-6-phosphate isomerase-like protein (cupin superfamily)